MKARREASITKLMAQQLHHCVLPMRIVLLCSALPGCGGWPLSQYEPQGSSARQNVLWSLRIALPMDCVYNEPHDANTVIPPVDAWIGLKWSIEDAIHYRPANPSFRSLCAIVN